MAIKETYPGGHLSAQPQSAVRPIEKPPLPAEVVEPIKPKETNGLAKRTRKNVKA